MKLLIYIHWPERPGSLLLLSEWLLQICTTSEAMPLCAKRPYSQKAISFLATKIRRADTNNRNISAKWHTLASMYTLFWHILPQTIQPFLSCVANGYQPEIKLPTQEVLKAVKDVPFISQFPQRRRHLFTAPREHGGRTRACSFRVTTIKG